MQLCMPKPTRSEIFYGKVSGQSPAFKNYFSWLPKLLTGSDTNLQAALAYQFHLIETAHHRALYGCLCRIHATNSVQAKKAVNAQHLSRAMFGELFKNVVGRAIPEGTLKKRNTAEKLRDKMIHGKHASEAELWVGIQSLTDYAIELNDLVKAKANFEPFGDMRGLVGRRGYTALSKGTTRWVLKGMGFTIS